MRRAAATALLALLAALLLACEPASDDAASPAAAATDTPVGTPTIDVPTIEVGDRLASIPPGATKVAPETDVFPTVLQLAGWSQPVPVPGPVTSAGAEDSPFIAPDGSEIYFFFTPDPNIPPEKQLLDTVTGIWTSRRAADGSWTEPERVVLNDDLALDGCETLHENSLWFCSARAGNQREIDIYVAERTAPGSPWGNVHSAGERLNLDLVVGELHVTADGTEIYFHRPALEGEASQGGVDLWVTRLVDGEWSDAENLGPTINSAADDLLPFVTTDGTELWFTSSSRLGYQGPAIFRSLRQPDGSWGPPTEVISQFAAEPTLDDDGNLYFAHHYFPGDNGPMIEADIYVAYRLPR
jgi:hypothetical protein